MVLVQVDRAVRVPVDRVVLVRMAPVDRADKAELVRAISTTARRSAAAGRTGGPVPVVRADRVDLAVLVRKVGLTGRPAETVRKGISAISAVVSARRIRVRTAAVRVRHSAAT